MAKTPHTLVSGHKASHPASAALCDELFNILKQRIPRLRRRESQRWCYFFQEGAKRFAYISHRKTGSRLEVWFLGEYADPTTYPGLLIKQRPSSSGGFGKDFKARFYLDDVTLLQSVCDLLMASASFAYARQGSNIASVFPDEVSAERSLYEGAVREVSVNAYERNPVAREMCIQYYGASCVVCGFNFGEMIGEIGEGVIHVHHLRPLSDIRKESEVDPVKDLRPVCPNCHVMIHRRKPPFTIEEVKAVLKWSSTKQKT